MTIPEELLNKHNLKSLEDYKNYHSLAGANVSDVDYYYEFLKATDHIPLKIVERLVEDLATATLTSLVGVLIDFIKSIKNEYHEELKYRKLAREKIKALNVN